jgi:hypothetical protein
MTTKQERAAAKKLARARAKETVARQRRLEVSMYEKVASWLIALLVGIGVTAFMLFSIWLSDRLQHRTMAVPVALEEFREDGEGGGDGRAAGGSQLDTPAENEMVGNDTNTTEVQQDLSAMGAAVAENAVELDDPSLVVPPKRQGAFGTGGGIWGGFGPGRGLGHGPGKPGKPRNWEVVFQKGTTEQYAKQLDFFKIELGVIKGTSVVYAFNLHKAKPNTRVEKNPAENEKRFYLRWVQGDLKKADEELLTKAGIEGPFHFILKFLPPEVEADLYGQELAKAGDDKNRIKKTRFGVRQDGERYEFYIIDQLYKR